MVDTFWLPKTYRISELFDDEEEDSKDITYDNNEDSPIPSTNIIGPRSHVITTDQREYDAEMADDFAFEDAKQDDGDGLMYGMLYQANDSFQGQSNYAVDIVTSRLQKTSVESKRLALENEQMIRAIVELKSENSRVIREKLEMEKAMKTQKILTISQEIQRPPLVDTKYRHTMH